MDPITITLLALSAVGAGLSIRSNAKGTQADRQKAEAAAERLKADTELQRVEADIAETSAYNAAVLQARENDLEQVARQKKREATLLAILTVTLLGVALMLRASQTDKR